MKEAPARASYSITSPEYHPRYVVWEITLSCNLKCLHCGSRAGRPRENELSTSECVALIDQLAKAGTKEITLIGGEAYLRRDWLTLIEAIAKKGILCTLQTGGRALSKEKVRMAKESGLFGIGVSIDGDSNTHDRLRGVRGSFASAMDAIANSISYGITTTANTQINRLNIDQLEVIYGELRTRKVAAWQLQLTVPMGNAADRPDLIIQPFELRTLLPRLYTLFLIGRSEGLRVIPGNNIGYFGPYEANWRSVTGRPEYYGGCSAGRYGLGIEADGSIKGCPSLPSESYRAGNIRDNSLEYIWQRSTQMAFMRNAKAVGSRAQGYCKSCYYQPVCGSGCTWTTQVVSGHPGNNPFCHYRVLQLEKLGLHERIVQTSKPKNGRPFDHGTFRIELFDNSDLTRPASLPELPEIPTYDDYSLVVCDRCDEFYYERDTSCPHCNFKSKGNSATFDRLVSALAKAKEEQRKLLFLLNSD